MSLRRFFLPADAFSGRSITITGETYRHMAVVLRLKAGDRVILADGSGREEIATIRTVGPDRVIAETDASPPAPPAVAGMRITLYQGLPKGEKIDLILQKATELGVHEIVAFIAARSVTRLDRERTEGRLARWERIVREAARQAGRRDIPTLSLVGGLDEALRLREHSVKLLLWEGERETRLRETLAGEPPDGVAFVVGPEGGLTEAEAQIAAAAGYRPVTLGSRVLRTETAALALLAILQYRWGDIG